MNDTNTLSMPQSAVRPSSNGAPEKKKCSGTCDKCLAKKRARELAKELDQSTVESPVDQSVAQPAAESNAGENAEVENLSTPSMSSNALEGVEFDGGVHKGLWSGCFRGTPDF